MLQTKRPRRKATNASEPKSQCADFVAPELMNGAALLWKEFQLAARRQRRNPQRLLTDYMRECIEIWEDGKLFREMSKQARRSGRKESEAVEIVREVRKAQRARRTQA